MLQVDDQPQASEVNADDFEGLVHRFCDCRPDRALCGTDLGGEQEIQSWREDEECVVCVELGQLPCEHCGQE